MKRTLLLIVSLLFFTGLSAQSLIIKKDGNNISGQAIDLLVSPEAGYGSYKVEVMNNTATVKDVKVRARVVNALDGVETYFCWVNCYAPGVMESPDALSIQPGATETAFEGDIVFPAGLKGLYAIKYIFFDQANPDDSSYATVNFNLGYLGTPENIVKSAKMSNAYPNPATSMVYVDYKLPANVAGAKLEISNLLGTTVHQVELNEREGKAAINVSNLKNGVYFYSLMVNKSATVTRKFVINR